MAKESEKRRSRICCHINTKDKTNEMIILLMQNSYVRPHIHPENKSESYTVLKGKMNVIVFKKNGKIKQVVEMGDIFSGRNFFYRMSSSYWHMPISVDKYCIYQETYSGPFVKKIDVKYAQWAPHEYDTANIKLFIKKLKILNK